MSGDVSGEMFSVSDNPLWSSSVLLDARGAGGRAPTEAPVAAAGRR